MLVAIAERLRGVDPTITLAVDTTFGGYLDRARYGLLYKLEIGRLGRSKLALQMMKPGFRKVVGIVRDHEIDAVLDASGFAFGDQLPLERLSSFAVEVERWAARGVPVILLPQALGPFKKSGHRREFARLLKSATMIYVRDADSLRYVQDVEADCQNVALAPDFTNLLKLDERVESRPERRVCIVPNKRMMEHATDNVRREQYLNLMTLVVEEVSCAGLSPVGLLHGDEDGEIMDRIRTRSSQQFEVVEIPDPVELKRYIGNSYLLVGSRFHALVNALSQGVPVLATGWSHKYSALLESYGQQNCLLSIDMERDELRSQLRRLVETERNDVLLTIRDRMDVLETKTREMWREIVKILGFSKAEVGDRKEVAP